MNFHSKMILAVVIVCNIAALFGYYFLFQDIKAKAQLANSLTSTIDVGQQKNSRLSSLRAIVNDTEVKRQQLSGLLLSQENEVSFIDQIEGLAKKSGLTVNTNNVSSSAGDTGSTKVFQMQSTTTGSWNDTMYFLSQLENLPYNVRVQGVSLGKQSDGNKKSAPSWVASFDISVTEST
jgi:Tfp pilus assembly protein PilO